MTDKPKKKRWGKRLFTPEQWLKRDMRSAATLSQKSDRKPSLPKLRFLEDKERA